MGGPTGLIHEDVPVTWKMIMSSKSQIAAAIGAAFLVGSVGLLHAAMRNDGLMAAVAGALAHPAEANPGNSTRNPF